LEPLPHRGGSDVEGDGDLVGRQLFPYVELKQLPI
jgi:hypothetical protein